MKRITLLKICVQIVLLVMVYACKKSDSLKENTPVKTDKGIAIGTANSTIIGPAGGTIESPDGNLNVTIPAGALSANTNVSVQVITNEAPLGIGLGYRLLPEGTTFNEPVQLTFHYSDALLDGTPPDFLWIVTQAQDGTWDAALTSVVDKNTHTVGFQASHFSDWAVGRFIDFTLKPSSRTVKKGESVQLKLTGFARDVVKNEDDDLAPLVPISGDGDVLYPLTPIPPIEAQYMDFRVKQWTMNGTVAPVSNSNGLLSPKGTNATYTAPGKKPNSNPIAVSVQLEANDKEGGKALFLLTSNISVVESDLYIIVKVDGVTYEYYEYGLNGTFPPDPNNFSGANCGHDIDNGSLVLVGTTVSNGTDFADGFGLTFSNPAVTTRQLVGFNLQGNDDMVMSISTKAYSLDYTKYVLQASGNTCEPEDVCGSVSVTLTTHNSSNVAGYFSGTLYDDNSKNWDQCKTGDVHQIEGEFNLQPVN